MKILSAEQIREADRYTILHEPILSIDLMERAAVRCTEWIVARYSVTKNVVVLCGPGNNGGDGLAIARLLHEKWYKVKVFILKSGSYSDDFSCNFERIRLLNLEYKEIDASDLPNIFSGDELIIDAIFGTGLSRPVEGWMSHWIKAVNQSKAEVVSIDLPSGLFADTHSTGSVIKANHTLSFQCVRLAFLFPENAAAVGKFHVIDIGLDKEFIEKLPCNDIWLEEAAISRLIKKRPEFSHKGKFGHVLLVAGSLGKMGAAILSSRACLRTGSGLLTVHVAKAGYELMQMAVPEAMVSVDEGQGEISSIPFSATYNSIAIGPGIGTDHKTRIALENFLTKIHLPVVADADALNIFSLNKEMLKSLPINSILTPHPKEFERLAGESTDDFDRHQRQLNFSKEYRCYVILKGAYTCITTPDGNSFFNSTGNPGMAKGGSGDALTGILAGLMAQHYSPLEVCLIGVYLHGLAGDLALDQFGENSMLPSDLIDQLGNAFGKLTHSSDV